MKTFSSAFLATVQSNLATLCQCWAITRKDGVIIRGTSSSKPVTIVGGAFAGTYNPYAGITGSNIKAAADMSVDNQEINGAFRAPDDVTTIDITHQDIVSGNFANAPVVVFVVDWLNPSDFQDVVGWGWLGDITEESTGHYRTEIRGPAQALATQIVQTAGDRCSIKHLGHGQCQFNIAANTPACVATTVVDRRTFAATGYGTPAWLYTDGLVTFTSGLNNGFQRMVQLDPRSNGGNILLIDEAPNDITTGDTFTMEPGCPRTLDGCKVFGQVINMQAPGIYVPGIDLVMAGPNGLPGTGP